MIRAVLDSNVWLSAIFWEGEASRIIELAEKDRIEITITRDILLEIAAVLSKESKFQRFLDERKQNIEDLIRTILKISTLIHTKSVINVIKEHPADNIMLDAALDSNAEYIVSYDKHILNLREFRGIKIVKPGEMLRLLNS